MLHTHTQCLIHTALPLREDPFYLIGDKLHTNRRVTLVNFLLDLKLEEPSLVEPIWLVKACQNNLLNGKLVLPLVEIFLPLTLIQLSITQHGITLQSTSQYKTVKCYSFNSIA